MIKNQNVTVSIVCATYNQKEYIRDALNGFLNQKTNFKYEVIVHDDASTDDTQSIIKEYADKYPDIIVPILQSENQFRLKVNKYDKFILPVARGKYIAVCEGDDYWTDPAKLQTQIDYMESHPDCSMCCHNSLRLNCMDNTTYIENPFVSSEIVNTEDLIYSKPNNWIAMASIVYRTELRKNMPDFFKKAPVGDYPMYIYMSSSGYVYYFDKVMSVYRFNRNGSWTESIKRSMEKQLDFNQRMCTFLSNYNNYSNHKYDETVNRAIDRYMYSTYMINDDYSSAAKCRCLNELPLKSRMKIVIAAKTPNIAGIYRKIKKKIHNGI